MSTSQNNQQDPPEKPIGSNERDVSAKTFLADVRRGVDDAGLMEKHDLTVSGLWKLFDELVTSHILEQAELDARINRMGNRSPR